MAELVTRGNLARCLIEWGECKQAIELLHTMVDAEVLRHTAFDEFNIPLSMAHCEVGEPDRAIQYASTALDQAKQRGYLFGAAQAFVALGRAYLAVGKTDSAFESLIEGLRVSRTTGSPTAEVEALTGLGLASGDRHHLIEAITVARRQGMRLLEAKALGALAEVNQRRGSTEEALVAAEQALSMFREFGHHPGERYVVELVSRLKGV